MKNLSQIGIIFFCTILLNSCSKKTENPVFWVNSFKTECDNSGEKSTCISISKNANLDSADWQILFKPIEGFEFKTGQLQKIEVEEIKQPNSEDIVGYNLVNVLEKVEDKKYLVNDIWAAYRIEGKLLQDLSGIPTLEVNLSKMQVFGNNGCNNYSGKLIGISNNRLLFGNIASTKKLCVDMETPSVFDYALNKSVGYKLDGIKLMLLDKNGNETIAFKKVD